MKKLFGLLSTCFILLVIISCSNLNETSSLSLTFNGSDFARNSSARNISVNPDYNGYYNPARIYIFTILEMIDYYTNIS